MESTDNGIRAIAWDVNIEASGVLPDGRFTLSRSRLEELVMRTTHGIVETISATFGFDDELISSMYERIADHNMYFTRNASEYQTGPKERLPFGRMATNAVGHLAVVGAIETVADQEDYLNIPLEAIEGEATALRAAAEKLLQAHGEDGGLMDISAKQRVAELVKEEPLIEAAVALAYARRLLKYVLIKPEDLGTRGAKGLGFEDWLEHCKARNTEHGGEKLTNKDIRMLARQYRVLSMANRNMRFSLWLDLFYGITRLNPKDLPFFYLDYAQNGGAGGDYSVPFQTQANLACRLSEETVAQGLSIIYTPKRLLRSV